MVLVWQILIAVVVLVGLITIIMSVKNWHWAQMLLLLAIFFTTIGVLFLGMEVYRIHRNLRAGMPAKKQQIADIEAVNLALRQGTNDPQVISRAFAAEPFNGEVPYNAEAEGRMPGLPSWQSRLDDLIRDRGRVWDGVKAGQIDAATGQISVQLPPGHGLTEGSIVFAFERGNPSGANQDQGAQYLGEFQVTQAPADGNTAVLQAVQKLDNRTGNRLVRSIGNPEVTWRLYESVPLDRHELFAGKSEQELRQLLPATSAEQYLRHGQQPTADDDEYAKAAFNEQGQRVALDDPAKTEERYDRPLRDYAYLFSELMRHRAELEAGIAGLTEDINRLNAANESAKLLTAHRQQELEVLEKDRQFMERDRQAIEQHRDKVLAALARAQQAVTRLVPMNLELAQELIQRGSVQAGLPEAPGGAEFLNAPTLQ